MGNYFNQLDRKSLIDTGAAMPEYVCLKQRCVDFRPA